MSIAMHMFTGKKYIWTKLSLWRQTDGLVGFSAESNGRQPRDSEERKNYYMSK